KSHIAPEGLPLRRRKHLDPLQNLEADEPGRHPSKSDQQNVDAKKQPLKKPALLLQHDLNWIWTAQWEMTTVKYASRANVSTLSQLRSGSKRERHSTQHTCSLAEGRRHDVVIESVEDEVRLDLPTEPLAHPLTDEGEKLLPAHHAAAQDDALRRQHVDVVRDRRGEVVGDNLPEGIVAGDFFCGAPDARLQCRS